MGLKDKIIEEINDNSLDICMIRCTMLEFKNCYNTINYKPRRCLKYFKKYKLKGAL
ncbi:MAG: hypothetical protein ACFFG0_03670 [Candidatus Thorarchaeota archaeon]